jgi:ADP-ribose pyrophosphatase YjhB (NUDIX family)
MEKGFDYIGVSVVTMCHDGSGRYLMEHRSPNCRDEQNTWSPVGSGGVKSHESLENAVRREVREECAAEAFGIVHMGHREVFREIDGKPYHWIAFDFKAQIKPEEVQITEPDKCVEQRWCRIDEIPEPKHSQFPLFLDKYKDKL